MNLTRHKKSVEPKSLLDFSKSACYYIRAVAPVAELADALDLGSSIERCAGSIPVRCTNKTHSSEWALFFISIKFITYTYICCIFISKKLLYVSKGVGNELFTTPNKLLTRRVLTFSGGGK